MSILPFELRNQTVDLDDGNGNSIKGIPVYGSATLEEIAAYESVVAKAETTGNAVVDNNAFMASVVAEFLRCRFNIPANVTEDEILSNPDGRSIPYTLIAVLFDFFVNDEMLEGDKKTEEVIAKKKSLRTGEKSTGNSKSITQTKKDSNPTESENALLVG